MFRNKLSPFFLLSLLTLMILSLASCGGGSSSDTSSSGDGTLALSLTDSTLQDYRAVYVTIDRVDVHRADGNWEVVANPPQGTYNLLELVNGVTEPLGEDSLPAGDYTQMRLIIGDTADNTLNIDNIKHPHANYLLTADNSIHELKIPSGRQTGIKLVGGFTINENQTTELLLDFDAMRSVVKAGASGRYLLKPTIKVLNTADYTSVAGTITNTTAEVATPLSGAFVSAQTEVPLTIQAGTVTDEDGGYKLFLMPGSYTLVATANGYLPACDSLTLARGEQLLSDFDLTPAAEEATFSLSGTVAVADAADDQSVTLTFYQQLECKDAGTATVVIRELNVGIGGSYEISLPAGDYDVVATTEGDDEIELRIESSLSLHTDRVEDFNFLP